MNSRRTLKKLIIDIVTLVVIFTSRSIFTLGGSVFESIMLSIYR